MAHLASLLIFTPSYFFVYALAMGFEPVNFNSASFKFRYSSISLLYFCKVMILA